MIKRLFDLVGASLLLLLVLPMLLVAALLIRLQLGGPVLFRQTRAGLAGRSFTLWKLRTMTQERGVDGELLPDEQRLTKLSLLMRKWSLDELPQLWNVIRGDLSLIGPRPLLLSYLPLYSAEQARRHEIRPGITGWAQVNGRNALSWEERLRLDVWYVDHHSIRLDVLIVFRTITTVLRANNQSHANYATMPLFGGSAVASNLQAKQREG